MAEVLLSRVAVEDIERLLYTHSLPDNSRDRIRKSLEVLEQFPRIGSELEGRWSGFRFILGPWRWLLIVYLYDSSKDQVLVATVQDARASTSATASGA